MATIRMTGWRAGLQKVSLTLALQRTGLALASAKSLTDRLLDGDVVDVQVVEAASTEILAILRDLGVEAVLMPDPPDPRRAASDL